MQMARINIMGKHREASIHLIFMVEPTLKALTRGRGMSRVTGSIISLRHRDQDLINLKNGTIQKTSMTP